MSRSYTLGLLLGLLKTAEEADEEEMPEFESETVEDVQDQGMPRQPKHIPKYIKAPRSLTGRKRRRIVRQRKLPKPLLSA